MVKMFESQRFVDQQKHSIQWSRDDLFVPVILTLIVGGSQMFD